MEEIPDTTEVSRSWIDDERWSLIRLFQTTIWGMFISDQNIFSAHRSEFWFATVFIFGDPTVYLWAVLQTQWRFAQVVFLFFIKTINFEMKR